MPSCYEMLPPGYNNDLLVLRLATLLGKIEGTTNAMGKKGFSPGKHKSKSGIIPVRNSEKSFEVEIDEKQVMQTLSRIW